MAECGCMVSRKINGTSLDQTLLALTHMIKPGVQSPCRSMEQRLLSVCQMDVSFLDTPGYINLCRVTGSSLVLTLEVNGEMYILIKVATQSLCRGTEPPLLWAHQVLCTVMTRAELMCFGSMAINGFKLALRLTAICRWIPLAPLSLSWTTGTRLQLAP